MIERIENIQASLQWLINDLNFLKSKTDTEEWGRAADTAIEHVQEAAGVIQAAKLGSIDQHASTGREP